MFRPTWTPERASWIWLPGEERPDNAYVMFRTSFRLNSVPDEATLRATADCRYLLSVNGVIVGRGPVTTDPRFKQVDSYAVAEHLRVGENSIAALVLQRHEKTSRLWPVRGGFLCNLEAGDLHLGTNDTWRARWAEEYRRLPPAMTGQYGQQEWLHGEESPAGWREPGFDDGTWERATVVSDPERHWPPALECRRVPHMLRLTRHPVRLVGYFSVFSKGIVAEFEHEPARQIEVDFVGSATVVSGEENISDPASGPVVFRDREADGVGFVVDMGEEMLGYPFVDFTCAEGVTLDLGHGEVLSRNRIQVDILAESSAEQRYADRYVTRAGRQRWEIFDSKGCRYLELHFRRVPKEADGALKVVIHEVGVVESRDPNDRLTSFSCSDKRLTDVFAICRRTAEVKHQDWHICDAQREQNQWLEMYQDMLYPQVCGRSAMLRDTIDAFSRGQLPSGYMPSTIPSISRDEQTPRNQYLFSTVCFPLIVWMDWLYGGADDRQPEWLDAVSRAFEALLAYVRPDGVFANAPGHHWAEWSGMDARPGGGGGPVQETWAVTFFNALLVLGLERAADMAETFGRGAVADAWRTQAGVIRDGADRHFWSEARQAYVDGVYDGEPSAVASQATNAIAALARLGSPERTAAALEFALDPSRYDVPVSLNNMALLHEAMESVGMDVRAEHERIRAIWGRMIDQGATTTWEQEMALERSNGCCFGFSAHPLNVLVRTALGIVPVESGYRRFSLRIVPGDLTSASGEVATPHGMIGVDWKRTDTGIDLHLTVPEGCTASIAAPQVAGGSSPWSTSVDGQAADLGPGVVATCTFLREEATVAEVGPGRHRIGFRPGPASRVS